MTEEWRAIPGWPLHLASSLGRIKSIGRFVHRPPKKPHWRPERIIKLQKLRRADSDKVTALTVRISRYGDGRAFTVYVHHLVLMAFVGHCPDGLIGCHNNGNPTDNRPENLRWDTHASNSADMEKHGTTARPMQGVCGGASHKAKLSDPQIVEIVESPWGKRGIGNKLADRFGVGNSAIYEVRRRYAKRPDLYEIIKRRVLCPMSPAT
jgi:hypothetical protein